MNTAELIYQKAKEIPEVEAREVLDFMERLRARREREAAGKVTAGDETKPVTPEEHAAWCERLRHLVESQPMTEGDTVARMRQEARY